MAFHYHVHIVYDAAPWKEEQHPRAKGGQFGSGGGGGAVHASTASWTGRPEGAPTPGAIGKSAAGKVGRAAKQAFRSVSKEDYETIKHSLPKAQQSLGQKLGTVAKGLPNLMKAWGREELQKAKHAAGALGAMAHGKRPTPEQRKGLIAFGVSLLLSTASMLTHGDPTGSVGHIAVALGQEFVDHAILEHGAKLGLGGLRHVAPAAMGGGDQAMGAAEMKLLQDFAATLARVVATYKIPEARLAELLGQAANGKQAPG